MTWDTWTTSHDDGLAWLFSAWLAQILLLMKVPNSRTYKSHRYSSQLKQHKTQHSNYTHAHSCSFYISHWWVEEARLAQILLFGTVMKQIYTSAPPSFPIWLLRLIWFFKNRLVLDRSMLNSRKSFFRKVFRRWRCDNCFSSGFENRQF
jgi:hypothetical protein